MITTIGANLLRFMVLLLLQVLVLDHLDVANGYMVPYLYVLFLLMLPFELPEWITLPIGAFTGLVLDTFSSTPGMHMSACVVKRSLTVVLLAMQVAAAHGCWRKATKYTPHVFTPMANW